MRAALESVFRTLVIGLAVYGGLDLARTALADDPSTAYLPYVASAQEVETLEERVAKLEDLLVHVSRDGNDIYVTGANLHVVNGQGDTQTTNGVGNVIIGYNETWRGHAPGGRTGSHMLVVGLGNDFTSYGGIVVGISNMAAAPYASVSGGASNLADGYASSVCGGAVGWAGGRYSTVTGGQDAQASGGWSVVGGGWRNVASGDYSWSTGGLNKATGWASTVTGGSNNEARREFTSVSGGRQNVAGLAGCECEINDCPCGLWASVSGGFGNLATGDHSVVSGGRERQATGVDDWRAGELFQDN